MTDDSIAVLSDIHGNRWALEAVIEDIENRGITNIINLGDSLYGPLDPAGTAELLKTLNAVSVRGNQDRLLIEDADPSSTLEYVSEQLQAEHIDFLKSLDITERIHEEVLLFHGTPDDDGVYLIHDVNASGLCMRSESGIQRLLKDRSEKLFLCGHDHLPNSIRLADNRLVVNPGSVGLPAYSDDDPHQHYVENRDPRARYCIIGKSRSSWSVEQLCLSYDHDAASKTAKDNDRGDWAFWLKTGRAS